MFKLLCFELLQPTFGGLNFSITGNMRAGIFVKEIIDKGQVKLNSSNQLKSGRKLFYFIFVLCFVFNS